MIDTKQSSPEYERQRLEALNDVRRLRVPVLANALRAVQNLETTEDVVAVQPVQYVRLATPEAQSKAAPTPNSAASPEVPYVKLASAADFELNPEPSTLGQASPYVQDDDNQRKLDQLGAAAKDAATPLSDLPEDLRVQ